MNCDNWTCKRIMNIQEPKCNNPDSLKKLRSPNIFNHWDWQPSSPDEVVSININLLRRMQQKRVSSIRRRLLQDLHDIYLIPTFIGDPRNMQMNGCWSLGRFWKVKVGEHKLRINNTIYLDYDSIINLQWECQAKKHCHEHRPNYSPESPNPPLPQRHLKMWSEWVGWIWRILSIQYLWGDHEWPLMAHYSNGPLST